MSLFFAVHTHSADNCPAKDPTQGNYLLEHLNPANARSKGVNILANAVLDGKHTFNLILEAEDESRIRSYLAPFEQAGTLEITPASHCEDVVKRKGC